MKDVEVTVWKPLIINGRMKKCKCKVKYYIEDAIAEDFLKKAESCKGHYVDRDSFKLYILSEMLKDNKEGVDLIKDAILNTKMNLAFIAVYFESLLD